MGCGFVLIRLQTSTLEKKESNTSTVQDRKLGVEKTKHSEFFLN